MPDPGSGLPVARSRGRSGGRIVWTGRLDERFACRASDTRATGALIVVTLPAATESWPALKRQALHAGGAER